MKRKRRTSKAAQAIGAAGILSIAGPATALASIPATNYSEPSTRDTDLLAGDEFPVAYLGTFDAQNEEIEGQRFCIPRRINGQIICAPLFNKAGGGAAVGSTQGDESITERLINSHGA